MYVCKLFYRIVSYRIEIYILMSSPHSGDIRKFSILCNGRVCLCFWFVYVGKSNIKLIQNV